MQKDTLLQGRAAVKPLCPLCNIILQTSWFPRYPWERKKLGGPLTNPNRKVAAQTKAVSSFVPNLGVYPAVLQLSWLSVHLSLQGLFLLPELFSHCVSWLTLSCVCLDVTLSPVGEGLDKTAITTPHPELSFLCFTVSRGSNVTQQILHLFVFCM